MTILALRFFSVLQIHGFTTVQSVAQVLGHQVISFDDGEPEKQPTALGGAPSVGEERRATHGRVIRRQSPDDRDRGGRPGT